MNPNTHNKGFRYTQTPTNMLKDGGQHPYEEVKKRPNHMKDIKEHFETLHYSWTYNPWLSGLAEALFCLHNGTVFYLFFKI